MKDKMLSGRFILTICAGVVFIYATVTKMLTPEAVALITLTVMKDYFGRSDREQKGTK
jgi:glutamine amidotransferase PdxT